MSQQLPPDHISKRRVRYDLSGVTDVRIERGQQYAVRDQIGLTFDVYYPGAAAPTPLPAVILVTGYADSGAERFFGCRFKDMGAFASWAELLAASGMIAIAYENRTPDDVHALIEHVRQRAETLGVDAGRLAVWSTSGHAPNALALIAENVSGLKCAALMYPYTLDRPNSRRVADASAQFRFVVHDSTSIDRLPDHVPLFVVRAGRDAMPGLNAALDEFVTDALGRNLPLTVVNHATAPHAFDLYDEGPASRHAIASTLRFLSDRLRESDS